MPHPRTFLALLVFVAIPGWLAAGHPAWGGRARAAALSIVAPPLRTLRGILPRRRAAPNPEAASAEAVRTEELQQEVGRLRRLLQLAQSQDRPAVAARVIGEDATPWFRTLLLDRGTAHGLHEGAAVVAEHGAVGQILEAGASTARVLYLTDPRFRLGAFVQRSRAHGLLAGAVPGRCVLLYLTEPEAAQAGDLVLTSGAGGGMPKGLLLGAVERVERDPSGLYWQALVTPAVDPSRVEEVLCLP